MTAILTTDSGVTVVRGVHSLGIDLTGQLLELFDINVVLVGSCRVAEFVKLELV